MGYLDTELSEEQRVMVDELSASELRELAHEVPAGAIRDHYQETSFWWADWWHDPVTAERVPYDPIPTKARLERASERGTFILEDR